MRKKPMEVEQHIEVARLLMEISSKYSEVNEILVNHYNPSNKIMKLLYRIRDIDSPKSRMKSELDNDYSRIATDDEINKHGYVYYDKRSLGQDTSE